MRKQKIILRILTLCLLVALIPSVVLAATTGWVQNSNGTWSYYDYSGYMYTSGEYYIDGEYYRFDNNGSLYTSHWYQDSYGDWYYYGTNGAKYRDGVYKINTAYYYFNWNGQMYKDTEFSADIYDADGNYIDWGYFRAKENGVLYVNEWYQDSYGDWYYYGANGMAAKDFLQVNGNWYFFYNDGWMAKDTFVYSEKYQAEYYIGKTGATYYRVPQNGWLKTDNGCYYYENGQRCSGEVRKIDNNYYGFDGSGRMYDNTSFDIYNTDGNYTWSYFRAKEGGALYVNEWYQDSDGDWYYYGANGAMYRGGVYKVNTAYYYFDWSGYIYKNREFSADIYDADGNYIDWGYFRAKENGVLYVNEWYQDSYGDWYYYGANGMAAKDFLQIGANWYFFYNDGQMAKDTFVYSEKYQAEYYIGKTGATYYRVPQNGWLKTDNGCYYYENGEYCYYEVRKIGNNYYGFDGSGRMYDDTTFDMSRYDADGNHTGWDYYRAKEGGVLYVNEWYQDSDGDWNYYGANGVMYRSGVYKVNTAYYYFNWSGYIYKNGEFSTDTYDANGDWTGYHYYRAKENGVLYVNEWYQDSWGDWYYYGTNGAAAKDFLQIGANWYFFYNDGRMVKDKIVYSEKYQANYYIGETGTSYVKAPQNGWWQVGDDYYYLENDQYCCHEVRKIDNNYYGFDWNGRMYDDTTFDMSRYDADGNHTGWDYYRAKEGGVLYVNEWYQEGSSWYYYGAKGVAGRDFLQIGANWYFFYNDGRMAKDEIVYSEKYQANYYIGETGTSSVKAPQNGWWQVGDNYYYLENDQYCCYEVRKIDNNYYGFAWNGRMYDDTTFGMDSYDANGNWTSYDYYRAKEGGALCVNEWYQDSDGDWYYYGAKGVAARDFLQVGGNWYFFLNDGQMVKDQVVYSGKYDAYYYISETGTSYVKAPQNDWWQTGGYYYYFVNGQRCSDEVRKIGNTYYGFDGYGRMYDNTSFSASLYDTNGNYTWHRFRAKEGGALYVNEWYQEGSSWYYYGAKGVAARDFLQLNGNWYFFDSYGQMVKDQVVYSEKYDAFYYISKDGTSYVKAPQNDWWQAGDYYYYFVNGQRCSDEVRKIGNTYYGFDWNGRMYDNTSFDARIYDANGNYTWHYFRAKKGGALCVNEWYQHSDGSWYYYGANGVAASDFLQVGGSWYFFNFDGWMVKDQVVYSDKYQATYYISKTGTSSVKAPQNGWWQVGGYYYYLENSRYYSDEVRKIGNNYYGFNVEGQMYDNTSFSANLYDTNGNYKSWGYFRAKEGGVLYVNEWYQDSDGDYYYYGDFGAAPRNKLHKINNITYGFNYYGRMYADEYTYIGSSYYAFDASGKQITAQGKQKLSGCYVYVKANGTLETGWVQISGKWHYFSPSMYANTLTTIDNKLYAVDNAGVCVAVTSNGIYDVGLSGKLYIENGKPATGWKQLNGSWYYFNTYMYTNGVYSIDDVKYVFDENGKLFTGGWLMLGYGPWFDPWYEYVYADASGKAYTGLKTINGQQYIFDEWGELYRNTTVTVNGVEYVVNASGVATKISSDGWKLIDGKYYYLVNGEPVQGQIKEINGKKYYFNSNGVLASEGIYWDYENQNDILVGDDGVVKTGWQQYKNNWYYAGTDGMLYYGKHTIGGKQYIFDYAMLVGTFRWNNKIVTTNSSGAIVSEMDPADGWYYTNDTVYYYKNGAPYTGWVGDYLIDYGRMTTNTWTYWEGSYYAFDAYGKYVKSGWHRFLYDGTDYSDYVYAKPGGKLCYNEWYQIGGVWYYFDGPFILTDGTYEIDGALCKFDSNGKYLGKTALSGDGWKQVGSDWYYLHAGKPVTGMRTINGKRYVFDYNGVLYTNGFYNYEDCYFYADASGAIPNYTGWKKISGEWCYFNSSNLPVIGWFQDGKTVYFGQVKEKNGTTVVGLATGYLYADGQLHVFNASGGYQGIKQVQSGWFNADGEWYYFKNGAPVTGYHVINNKGYYFTADGMAKNEILNGRYFGSDGAQITTKGWYKTADGWVYVKDNGTLANNVQKINGKEYYFSGCILAS